MSGIAMKPMHLTCFRNGEMRSGQILILGNATRHHNNIAQRLLTGSDYIDQQMTLDDVKIRVAHTLNVPHLTADGKPMAVGTSLSLFYLTIFISGH
jgi:hypothetical protein